MVLLGELSAVILVVLGILLIFALFRKEKASVQVCQIVGGIACISLTVVPFTTFPNSGTDLRRYYEIISEMDYYTVPELFTTWIYGTTPLTVFLFFVVEKIGVYHLLPAIATFVIFTIQTYIVCRFVRTYHVRFSSVSLFVLTWIGISGLRAILTGVRQHLALALFSLAVCRLFMERKKGWRTIIIAICAILIHVGTIPLVATLLVYIFFEKFRTKAMLILFGMIAVFTNIKIPLSYFQYLQYKFAEYNEILYPDMRFFFVRIVFFIVLVIACYINRGSMQLLGLGDYTGFFCSLGILAMVFFGNQILFDRIFTAQATISFPVVYTLFDKGRIQNEKVNLLLLLLLLFLLCGVFAYQYVDLKTSWRFWSTILS